MRTRFLFFLWMLPFLWGCADNIKIDRTIDVLPEIYPDYKEVTVPADISPLNFALKSGHADAFIKIVGNNQEMIVREKKAQFTIPASEWRELLQESTGSSIEITVCAKVNNEWIAFLPFQIYIAKDPIDSYLAYRLIEPGYTLWNQMGIYQRQLTNYSESAIIENKMTRQNCMNCHSFPNQNPNKMLLHMRGELASTVLIDGEHVEKLNTKTPHAISSLVYPSWHPSERYIAFTVNDTKQSFHTNHKNLVEVYDAKSDVVIYDVKKHEIFTAPQLFDSKAFESFPTFSPDGKTLYFCTADSCSMPGAYEKVKYSLCAIAFDPDTRRLGPEVDTLFNARTENQSVSFPRVSPDGKYLLYGKGDYGGFFIWHKEADLHMLNLATGKHFSLDEANSPDAESYHTWSSNSRWIAFASRRLDGLYSRVFISYIREDGTAAKPFLLPQENVEFYERFGKSYNVPEFITGKVKKQGYSIANKAKNDPGTDIKFILELINHGI